MHVKQVPNNDGESIHYILKAKLPVQASLGLITGAGFHSFSMVLM